MEIALYIVHYKSLVNRKQNIEKLISLLKTSERIHNVSVKYVTEYDPESLDKEEIVRALSTSPPMGEAEDSIFKRYQVQTMHIRQVSNLMKHNHAHKLIAETTDPEKVNVVLEDDIIFSENIVENMVKTFTNCKDHDIMFLGLPSTTQTKTKNGIESVFESFNVLPCVDSYVIKRDAAKQLQDVFYPLYFPTHIQLSYCIKKANLSGGFIVPNIFADGSKVGVYTSVINCNNKLFLNADYNEIFEIAKKQMISEEDYTSAMDIFEQRAKGIKAHPDMLYLISVIEYKKGDTQKAYTIMSQIYDLLKLNGCILNHESEFLRLFIDMNKYLV